MHIESRHGAQPLFYSRTNEDSSTSQDAAGLGFLAESLASPQDSQLEHLSGALHRVAPERQDSTQGQVLHKMTTRAQEAGAPPPRHAASEKTGLGEQVHEDHVDDNPFSPFSEFLSVRHETTAAQTPHDGYTHQH